MANYTPADGPERIGKSLIEKHHSHLHEASICWLFVDPPPKSKGKVVHGRASKVSAKTSALLETVLGRPVGEGEQVYDFLVEISEESWLAASPGEREALVDHELMHCWWKWDERAVVSPEGEKVKEKVWTGWTMRSHDVEEFSAIVDRHGLWSAELAEFVETAQRLRLVETAPAADEASAKAAKVVGRR